MWFQILSVAVVLVEFFIYLRLRRRSAASFRLISHP